MRRRGGDDDSDGVDGSSVHQLLREGDEKSQSNLNAFRYTGRSNPSKVFMLLQNATGTTEENENASRPPQPPNNSKHYNKDEADDKSIAHPDDVVEMSYVGKKNPSRTFINLQNAVIDRDPYSSTELLDSMNDPNERSVKVVHLRHSRSIDAGVSDF